jgi:large subunit ribosomal protein L24
MAKAMRIKTDDTVIVISGKDKGKSGRVIRVEPARRRVFDVSNVMLLDPSDNKPTRVGMRVAEDGARVRVSKRTGKPID